MRLAVFLKAPEVWGAERSLLTLLGTEAARAHEIDVFIGTGSPLASDLALAGVTSYEFEFVKHKSLTYGGLQKATPHALVSDITSTVKQAIRTRKLLRSYDAALTFGLWETAEIALAGRIARTPVVFDFHVTFSGRIGRAALRGIASITQGVIAPSVATYRQAGMSPDSRRFRVVPRPVNTLRGAKPPSQADRKLHIGIFGQVDERKGVLEVVNTLGPLADQVTLMVVGARPQIAQTDYEKEVIRLVSQQGNGWIVLERTSSVGELMSDCDVVLNTSRHEAFGRTVVEAASVGALPLVMGGGGPEEILNDMGYGRVISSWAELQETVLSLSNDLRSGRHVRLNAEEVKATVIRYSPTAIAEEYFQHLEDLVRSGKRAAG